MSMEYPCHIIAEEQYSDRMERFLTDHSDDIISLDQPIATFGVNIPIDWQILRYIEEHEIRFERKPIQSIQRSLRDNNTKRCFDTIRYSRNLVDERSNVYRHTFAASYPMNSPFRDSPAVRRWLIDLSLAAHAEIAYHDLGLDGIQILCLRGKEVDIFLRCGRYNDAYHDETLAALLTYSQHFPHRYQ